MRWRGLYLLADTTALPPEAWPALLPPVLDAGPVLVQFRDKTLPLDGRERLAAWLQARCQERGIPLLINDDPMLCARIDAAGVHLGASDPALDTARVTLPPDAIIGASCYADLHRAEHAVALGADYLSFGRLFPSRTKPEAPPLPAGLLAQARARFRQPICAIGGIDPDNAGTPLAQGVELLCVAGGIWSASEPAAAAQRLAAHCAQHFSN